MFTKPRGKKKKKEKKKREKRKEKIPIRSRWETPKIHNVGFYPEYPNLIEKQKTRGETQHSGLIQ